MSESGTVMPGPDLAVARSMSSTANGEIAVVFDKDGATDQIRQWCQKFNLAVDQFVAQSSALWNSIFGPDRAAGAKVTVGLASLLALGLDSTEFPPAWQAPSEFPMGPLEAFVAKCGWHSPGQQSAADAAVTTLQELWQQWCEKRPSRIFSTVCGKLSARRRDSSLFFPYMPPLFQPRTK